MWPAGVGLPCPCCGFGVMAWTRDYMWKHSLCQYSVHSVCVCVPAHLKPITSLQTSLCPT